MKIVPKSTETRELGQPSLLVWIKAEEKNGEEVMITENKKEDNDVTRNNYIDQNKLYEV